MSAISEGGKPTDTKAFLVAHRRSASFSLADGKVYVGSGFLECDHCRRGGMSRADFARIVGVSVGVVSRWLDRKPVREDMARRIREFLLRVEE